MYKKFAQIKSDINELPGAAEDGHIYDIMIRLADGMEDVCLQNKRLVTRVLNL